LPVSGKTTYGGHSLMFGIVVDIPAMCSRYVRSALPDAPVIEDAEWRRTRARRARRRAVQSRHG
jgi:hypothetical protein